MHRHYVVIGLGRLGSAMLGTLGSLGHEVLGIDSDEALVQNLSNGHYRCWTGAMRPSENSDKAKFAEFLFWALG